MKKAYFYSLILLVIIACKKKEEVIVPNNKSPQDNTVNEIIYTNYTTKVYISLTGKKPTDAQLSSAVSDLKKNNFSQEDRESLITSLQNTLDYRLRLYEIARTDLLNNLDTAQIPGMIASYNQSLTDSSKIMYWNILTIERDKLVALTKIPVDLANNTIDIIEVYKRCCNNIFYDEINMGTQNFVTSMFDHFFYRYPSQDELAQATKMVDGTPASVLFQSGKTKNDFITILFASNNFYEGQVRNLFERYLYKAPSVDELNEYTTLYKASRNYKTLQKAILTSNEYAGIN